MNAAPTSVLIQEVEGRGDPRTLDFMVGRMDNIRTEPLDERVHRDLEPTPPRDRPKQRELDMSIGGDQIVGDQTDQAERAGMSELIEKIDAARV